MKVIDVELAVRNVYALLDLESRAEEKMKEDSPSAFRRRDQFLELKRTSHDTALDYAKLLARAFRDYIAITTAGEARHASAKCQFKWKGFAGDDSHRNLVYEEITRYSPNDVMTRAAELFHMKWQGGGYGGESWARIAEAGLLYGTMPDIVFLDHVVDLSHNSGLFLDKCIIFTLNNRDRYRQMLTNKTNYGLLKTYETLIVSKPIAEIMQQGKQLGLHFCYIESCSVPDFEEERVVWGNEPFNPELIPSFEPAEEEGEENATEGLSGYDDSVVRVEMLA